MDLIYLGLIVIFWLATWGLIAGSRRLEGKR